MKRREFCREPRNRNLAWRIVERNATGGYEELCNTDLYLTIQYIFRGLLVYGLVSARDEGTLRVSGIAAHTKIVGNPWLGLEKPKRIYQKVSLGLWQNVYTILGRRFLQPLFRCENKTEIDRKTNT